MSKIANHRIEEAQSMIEKAIKMFGTNSRSSYEHEILDVLREAKDTLDGDLEVTVSFTVPRRDLRLLVSMSHFGSELVLDEERGEDMLPPDEQLFSRLIQYMLYDSDEGPQLEGRFSFVEKHSNIDSK